MIDVNDIKGRGSASKLEEYSGSHPYILYLKKKHLNDKHFQLTKNQHDYIEQNYDRKLEYINKIVSISSYIGEQFKKDYLLNHIPKRILIETILHDGEKSLHCIGKLFRNQKQSTMFWIPKTQIFDDLEQEVRNVEIDWDEVDKLSKAGKVLYQHQREGIEFLLSRDGTILADDMGLGKTLQSIVASVVGKFERILIMCPASLKINWKREIMDFVDEDDISIIYGSNWEPAKYTIINYDIIKNFHTVKKRGKEYEDWELRREIAAEEFDLIICDEAHYLKNNTSQRTKIVLDIHKKFSPKSFWLLTGTPISNRPMDYYPLLTLVNSHLTRNWKFFAKRYCGAINFRKNGKMIWITDGASNLDELNEQTKSILLRRKKDEVLDLPDKIIIPYYLELPDRDVYENVFNEYLEWARLEGKRMGFGKHLVELTILRKFIAFEKIKFSMELVDTALDQNKKVIIFTNFQDELDTFMNLLGKKAVCIHGGVKGDARQAAVDKFQNNDDIKVLVGQVKAAGVGLTLTAAEVVIINSLDWVPGNLEQAEDRAYRLGQEKNVTVYYPLFEDTVDTLVWKSLQRKKEIIDTIIGDETVINEILDNLDEHG